MSRRELRRVMPAIAAGLLLILAGLAMPLETREILRQRVFDRLLAFSATVHSSGDVPNVVVIDIDEASLEKLGPWPWRREQIARLVTAVTSEKPAAVAIDILLAEADVRSPAALARQLATETGRTDLAELAERLPDGDKLLAQAVASGPVALGFVLDPQGRRQPDGPPILLREHASFGSLWREDGASGPPEALTAAAAGLGSISLPGDADAVVRRVPLFLAAGTTTLPGLAAEALRLSEGASGYLISAGPSRVQIGSRIIALPADGMLPLIPGLPAAPTLSAADFLQGSGKRPDLRGAIVMIGGSAPQLGGLRASASDPLTSSAVIQANAIRQLGLGRVPQRIAAAAWIEAALAFSGIALAAITAVWLGPFRAAVAIAIFVGGTTLSALGLAAADLLLDPVPAVLCALAALIAASASIYGETRLREAKLRRRFEQHLAPGVVERIVAAPGSLKLSGEMREITALFTDIEGFTNTARIAGPEQLVSVLDVYFEGLAGIIETHGGTIDKFVGDAVHAFFNAPFDLDGHPERAVACARAIVSWTEAHRNTGEALAIGLGRTRIGVETGMAIVGDVGIRSKLDYTAHGDVMNTAARLEALNKEFGTAICIGPLAAERCGAALTSLGTIGVRGLETMEIFTVTQPHQHDSG